MEKLVRFRKAFYEKENDLHHNNKKKELLPKTQTYKLYQSLPQHILKSIPLPTEPPTATAAYCQHYAPSLLEPTQYHLKPPSFMKNHQIDPSLRARMLDWMVEVTTSYKFTHKTYFDGVQLMDRYFERQFESIQPTKLHIIGVQCMLIASKMEEVYPLKIKTVYQKIGHRKLPMDELVEMESKIMKTLDYKLNSWTFFDFIMLKLSQYAHNSPQTRPVLVELLAQHTNNDDPQSHPKDQLLRKMEAISSYLAKLAVYDYDFYCQNSVLLLAETILKMTFEIMSLNPPPNFFTSSPILIELCRQKLLKIGKQFKHRFSGLNNIFKFTPKDIVSQVEQLY